MASNNYVPVKVLKSEIDHLRSESFLMPREVRLERMYMIYKLGLIDDMFFRDLNREICKKFPPDEPAADQVNLVTLEEDQLFNLLDLFSNSELILISEQLSVRMDNMKYMIDKYSQRPGNERFVESHKKELSALVAVSNKIVKLINYVNDKENKA